MASKTKIIQVAMNGGEVSPMMTGRIDDSKYQAGLASCKNFLCRPQGPVENRSGFECVGEVKDSSKPVRLIPFAFNDDQTCVIELGHKYARFHTQGKTILSDSGEPYEIVTPWDSNDLFDIHYVQSADVMTLVHSAYPPMELRRLGMTNWKVVEVNLGEKLPPPINPQAIRKTKAAEDKNEDRYQFKYAITALSKDKINESLPAYTEEVTANLYAYGTTVEISCTPVEGASYYRFYKCQGGLYGYIGDSTEPKIVDDDIDADMSVTPPLVDDVFRTSKGITSVQIVDGGNGYVTDTGAVGEPVSKGWKHVIKKKKADKYPEPDVSLFNPRVKDLDGRGSGATVVLECSIRNYINYVKEGTTGKPVDRPTVDYWCTEMTVTRVIVTNPGKDYVNPVLYLESLQGGTFGRPGTVTVPMPLAPFGASIEVNDSTGYGAELVAIIRNGKITDVIIRKGGKNYVNPTLKVTAPFGSGAQLTASVGQSGSYPAAVGYYEQRRVFGGLSQDPQRIVLTRTGTEDDVTYCLPSRDDDRISYQIASTQFNEIRHIVPLSNLILLTSGSEVRIASIDSDALTPSSFSAKPQGFIGASMVQPVIANNNVIYVGARGGHVRELSYQQEAGGFLSGDICIRASHLFDEKEIKDVAMRQAPYPILWFVSSSGDLLGLTYVPDQAVGAWHRHTTKGAFESCACVAEGIEDSLYCVIRRFIKGKVYRFIERMRSRVISDVSESFFVDCGGTYRGKPTKIISGLHWLEGETVSILADGLVQPQAVVVNGQVELSVPASTVHVGLPIEAELKTLPVALNVGGYGAGVKKNVTNTFIKVVSSRGMFVGPDENNLVEWKQKPGTPTALETSDVSIRPKTRVQTEGSISIVQKDPIPITIASLAAEVEVSG